MPNPNQEVHIRKAQSADHPSVIDIVKATNLFYPVEIEVAWEVFDDAAMHKTGCNYRSWVAQLGNQVVGWVCYGATPCTLGTFDIYWIVVDPARQRQGIGTKLLQFAESKITRRQGRLIVIETSSTSRYSATREFYQNNGYTLSAAIEEFYAPGDNKLIYTKILPQNKTTA